MFELVTGTVVKVEDHGAFVTLDEYGGLEAYVPLNEVSHSWFKSIREVLKVGQKRVFKVIRVDPKREHVDLSLKRVSERERQVKMLQWKRYRRALNLLELASKKLGRSFEEAMEEGRKLEEAHGDALAGFEAAVREGSSALEKAGVREPWLSAFYEVARSYVKVPRAKLSGVLTISCLQGDGIERLRRVLIAWREVKEKYPDVDARFYTIGAPRHRIDVEAYDPKRAETFLADIVRHLVSLAAKEGCQADFQRLKTE